MLRVLKFKLQIIKGNLEYSIAFPRGLDYIGYIDINALCQRLP